MALCSVHITHSRAKTCLVVVIAACFTGSGADCPPYSGGVQGIAMLMRRPVGAGSLAAEESDREAHPEWKLRKWVLRVSYRILQRYGDPKLTRTDAAAPFAKLFMDEFTQDFLQARPRTPSHTYGPCIHM